MVIFTRLICILFQTKMEVTIKYHITNQSTISAMTYHPKIDLLATAAANSDTCTFFTTAQTLQLQPQFTNDSKPPGNINSLSWSPDGRFLALGHTKVEVWKFENVKFCPYKTFNEDFIEVKNICWSPDSQKYICSGLSKSREVHIRNVETGELEVLAFDSLVVSSLFDQFGKYIAILSSDNKIHIYDSTTLNLIKNISMAETKKDINSVKDRRIMAWSPDFTLLASPNLNDLKVSSAVVFDRKKNFTVKNILIGHRTPINCLKFNPHIYEFQDDKVFILAMGDSSGTLSLWRIGTNKIYGQPLIIASSPIIADESIEQIEWDLNGEKLFVHVMKKYVAIYEFKKENFGLILSEGQKADHIEKIFGVMGVTEITGKQLEIFGMGRIEEEKEDRKMPKIQQKFQDIKTNEEKVLIKTPQETIINGGKKKRIIPSRHIEEKEMIEEENMKKQKITIQEQKQNKIKIKPLKIGRKETLNLDEQKYLELKVSPNLFQLRVLPKAGKETQVLGEKYFSGISSYLSTHHDYIFLVNQNSLHILDFSLDPLDLPIYLGQIADLTANDEGDVYYMLCDGQIRGFNFLKRQFITQTSINYVVKSQGNTEATENPLSSFKVYNNDQSKIHIEIRQTQERFFFDRSLNSWINLDFNIGFFMEGHSLQISKKEAMQTDNFFNNLKNPPKMSQQTSVMEYELQLLYYKKYCKDEEMFRKTLMKMFSDLRNSGKEEELRKKIEQYFINKRSPNFIEDKDFWMEVKKIGGPVIQEFMLMEEEMI